MDTKEIITDFKESFIDRVRNPFVLLYGVSWIAWNWLLVYELLTFPSDCPQGTKVKIINDYIQDHIWGNLTFWPILSAFIGACVFIVCAGIFLLMFSWFQRTLRPLIYRVSARGENIPRRLYNSLHKRYDQLKQDFEDSKELWLEFDNKKQELEDKINHLEVELRSANERAENLNNNNNRILGQLETLTTSPVDTERIFTTKFVNGKFWTVKARESNGTESTEMLRFQDNDNVYAPDNTLAYLLEKKNLFADNQVIRFTLKRYNNLTDYKTHTLFNAGEGIFYGMEISSNGGKRHLTYIPPA